MIQERRRLPRYRLDATIAVNDRDGRTIDISSSGIFFESPMPFVPGEEVVLVLPLQETRPGTLVRCKAQVLRVEPRGEMFGVAATYEPVGFSIPADHH